MEAAFCFGNLISKEGGKQEVPVSTWWFRGKEPQLKSMLHTFHSNWNEKF